MNENEKDVDAIPYKYSLYGLSPYFLSNHKESLFWVAAAMCLGFLGFYILI